MMKKSEYRADYFNPWIGLIIGVVLGLLSLLVVSSAHAGGVTDNNNGHAGDVLVSTGQNNGANSIGTWTDSSFLKGDKGDTGNKGDQGNPGPAGQDGQSITGPQGDKGDKGDPGNDGQSVVGPQGDKGDKGDQGNNGGNGEAGHTPVKGVDYFDGLNGLNGINGMNGKDVDPGTVNRLDNRIDGVDHRVGQLERTQFVAHTELVLQQGRRHKVGVYGEYNFGRHQVSEVGVAITIALDDSYEMKEVTKLNEKIERLQWALDKQNIETETVHEGNKTIIRIKQKDGVIKLMNRF